MLKLADLTPSEQTEIEKAGSQLDKGIIYNDANSAKIMLAALQEHYANQGRVLDAYYRSDSTSSRQGLVEFTQQLHAQSQTLQEGETRRVQLVYRSGIHTTLIDFKLTKNNIDAFMVDSAGHHPTMFKVHSVLTDGGLVNKTVVATGATFNDNPQKSHNMCLYFAMAQLETLQDIDPYPDLEKFARERPLPKDPKSDSSETPICQCVEWLDLDPRFIKDTESRGLLENYLERSLINNPARVQEAVIHGIDGKLQTLQAYVGDNLKEKETPSDRYPNFPIVSRAINNRAVVFYGRGSAAFNKNIKVNPEAILKMMEKKDLMSMEAHHELAAKVQQNALQSTVTSTEDLSSLKSKFEKDSPYDKVPAELRSPKKKDLPDVLSELKSDMELESPYVEVPAELRSPKPIEESDSDNTHQEGKKSADTSTENLSALRSQFEQESPYDELPAELRNPKQNDASEVLSELKSDMELESSDTESISSARRETLSEDTASESGYVTIEEAGLVTQAQGKQESKTDNTVLQKQLMSELKNKFKELKESKEKVAAPETTETQSHKP